MKAARCLTAPNGEVVVDFGQEVTGYIQFTVDAKAGEKVEISHGEVLDKDGNFYNANYRSAKSKIYYTCCDGVQTYKPKMTFSDSVISGWISFRGLPVQISSMRWRFIRT